MNTFNNTRCHLFDLYKGNSEYEEYTKPIYTKFNGMYGYLCVSVFTVCFFWHDEQNIYWDDVSDRFRVEYVESNF